MKFEPVEIYNVIEDFKHRSTQNLIYYVIQW